GVAVHLAIHHAAPAAVVGPDVQENRPIEPGRERERVASPLLPAHGLARGARQIRRRRLRHTISEWAVLGNAGDGEDAEEERRQRTHGAAGRYTVPPRPVPAQCLQETPLPTPPA